MTAWRSVIGGGLGTLRRHCKPWPKLDVEASHPRTTGRSSWYCVATRATTVRTEGRRWRSVGFADVGRPPTTPLANGAACRKPARRAVLAGAPRAICATIHSGCDALNICDRPPPFSSVKDSSTDER